MSEMRYPRDATVLAEMEATPFHGYAVQPSRVRNLSERVLASTAILGIMLISGVVLGTPRR